MLSPPQYRVIADFIGNKKFSRIYSATKDGFYASHFKDRCCSKGATLTLVKSANGFLFGGYASISWENKELSKSALDSFIFTLTNPHDIKPTKYAVISANDHLYDSPKLGPSFGLHDMEICGNANTVDGSRFDFPKSYADTTGKGCLTFTGAKEFRVVEIEVFQVIPK